MKQNKEYLKQIVLISLGVILIFVGLFNYKLDDNKMYLSDRKNEINLGDVELVNSEPIEENNVNQIMSAIVSNDELINKNEVAYKENLKEDEINEEILTQENKANYFNETKLERDRMYSENLELYQNLLNKTETPSDQKAIAMQEITNITNTKNGIMIAENLIKNKGFEDVVILVNNGVASIVVKAYTLNQEQISKIQNVVERELNIDVKNINISNKY